jgi:hypothetical protein
MSLKNRVVQIALIIASSAMFAASGNAQTAQVSDWGTLTALQAGWEIDRMLVFHAAPITDADPPCPLLTNGYIVNEEHTGHNLFNTMLITALLNRREVSFVILGCFEDRPQIVSVSIR